MGKEKELVAKLNEDTDIIFDLLDDLKKKGIFDEELYEFFVKRINSSFDCGDFWIDTYKKAYKKRNVNICAIALIGIWSLNNEKFIHILAIRNCILNPLAREYSEDDYNFTMRVFTRAQFLATKDGEDKKLIADIKQCVCMTHVLYKNSTLNLSRLKENKLISNYSYPQQIVMICIYIQDQARLMRAMVQKEMKKRKFTTGMEADVADKEVDNYKAQKESLLNVFEATLEYCDAIIRFIFYNGRNELIKDANINFSGIDPYNKEDFYQILHLAQQRVIYLNLEMKFRYSNWRLTNIKTSSGQNVILFYPRDETKYKAYIVAGIRKRYQLITTAPAIHDVDLVKNADHAIAELSRNIEINNFEKFRADKRIYETAKGIADVIIKTFKAVSKPFYFSCNFDGIGVDDIILGYEFIFTLSQIYMKRVLNNFDENDESNYKYLTPIVSFDFLVNEFSRLYNRTYQDSSKILNYYVYDNSVKNNDGDIFTRPLIRIGETKIVFCEVLIVQINLERMLEKLLSKNDVDLAPSGLEFESKMVEEMSCFPNIKVNKNKIKFLAYDGRDVEFDFLGTMGDHLLLIEFKCIVRPYDDKQLYKAEQVIKKCVEQVNRRASIIMHDWAKIKSMASIELPEIPYDKSKIIKLVCTNLYDFTTLIIDGVRITDETTLKNFFSGINIIYSPGEKVIIPLERTQSSGKPTAEEFIKYLENPITVGNIPACLQKQIKLVPSFEGDTFVGYTDFSLAEDPYYNLIAQKLSSVKGLTKVSNNSLCPCGSGKKFKRCCGFLLNIVHQNKQTKI